MRNLQVAASGGGGGADAVEPGFCAAGHALVKGAAAYDEGWCDSYNYERMDAPGEEKKTCFVHISSMRDAWSCLICGVDFCQACNFKLAEHGGRSSSDAAAARRALFQSNYAVVNALLAANPGAAALRAGGPGGDAAAAAATLPLETLLAGRSTALHDWSPEDEGDDDGAVGALAEAAAHCAFSDERTALHIVLASPCNCRSSERLVK